MAGFNPILAGRFCLIADSLAAIHSFFGYASRRHPEHVASIQLLRRIGSTSEETTT